MLLNIEKSGEQLKERSSKWLLNTDPGKVVGLSLKFTYESCSDERGLMHLCDVLDMARHLLIIDPLCLTTD